MNNIQLVIDVALLALGLVIAGGIWWETTRVHKKDRKD